MCGVDEGTEEEILKNLNITADELLAACNLDTESSTTNGETSAEDQFFGDTFDEKNQNEFKPEYQQTLDDLEKELTNFREIHLHEAQSKGEEAQSDMIRSQNPKYINHAKLDDHLLYK